MKKNGFTLIELLAVIIILGVLMIIAIPAVTRYINESRESGYVSTAKSIVNGVRTLLHSDKFNLSDKNTTYYIPASYVKTDNGYKSPYGEFVEAYVGVILNNDGYSYYWISVDDAGMGVDMLTPSEDLDSSDIKSNINRNSIKDIVETTSIGNRNKIMILNIDTEVFEAVSNDALESVSEEGIPIVCKKAEVLHTKTCMATAEGCFAGGYVLGNKGTTITYGSIPEGSPVMGNAYDCKVKKSEGYTERFYFITSDGDNSVLLHDRNIYSTQGIAYDSSNENNHGPRTAYQILPSKSEWDNPLLIAPGIRNITGNYGDVIVEFDYGDKAARFLTIEEARAGCPTNISGHGLDNCNYYLDNVGRYESDSGILGYWLETPLQDTTNYAENMVGSTRHLSNIAVRHSGGYGVRPAITIKTKYIEQ